MADWPPQSTELFSKIVPIFCLSEKELALASSEAQQADLLF
jgi:hypothetical protein